MFDTRSRLRILSALLLLIGLYSTCCSGLAADATSNETAQRILEKSDAIRFPKQDFQVDVTIATTERGGSPDIRKFRIYSKGNENSLVLTTAPAVDRGQILLMKQRDLWVYLPNLSQPVRLPLSQRLTGIVAYGDLARANFLGDYNPSLLRVEKIKGTQYFVLELNAVDRSVTYHRVVYWVNKSNYRPYRAEFYTVSGRLMKTAIYENFQTMGGALRPTRLTMTNALHEGEQSILEYSDMKLRRLEDKVFTKDYLKKLQ